MKKIFIFFLLLQFLFTGAVTAQDQSTTTDQETTEEIVAEETVTIADLGVSEPKLLPTSPFYFFKEMWRGVQRALTFNVVKKTELELKIVSEKAAEAKKVAEEKPNDEKGISRALANYERAQERLRERIKNLGETSENPNVDRLLDMLTQRQIVHEKLLEDIEMKHSDQEESLGDIRSRIQETFGEIAEHDTAEKFQERLQDALETTRGSALKHIRSIEILDRLEQSGEFSDEVITRFGEIRDRLTDRARDNVDDFVGDSEDGANRLKDALSRIPGDILHRTIVLEELRGRVSERAANALEEARDSLDENIEDGQELADRVKEQIEESEQKLQRIETKLRESDREIPQTVTTLVDQAKEHLEKAKTALREGNPRQAFGLARAGQVIIANILHLLERGFDFIERTPEELSRILDRVNIMSTIRDTAERETDDDSEESDGDSDDVFCTLQYDPVCGVDGNTYGNRCMAEQQHKVRVEYEGECRSEKSSSSDGASNSDSTQERSVEEVTLEGDDYGFYPSNEIRIAKGSKIKLTFKVREENVYYAGLDLRSSKFDTRSINPGESKIIEFTADESFEFKSYWPASGVLKATGKVIVE